MAAIRGKETMVKEPLHAGANIGHPSNNGCTALFTAASGGYEEVVLLPSRRRRQN
jgi:hypothetical protein